MSDDTPRWSDRGLPPELDPRRARGRRGRRRLRKRFGDAVVMSSFAPPPAGRGRRVTRALSWTALGTSLVMLVVFTAGFLAYRHLDGNLTRANVFAGIVGTDRPTKAPAAGSALNVLLVGSDSRGGDNSGYQGTGKDYVTSARSDTTIVAHISADRQSAIMMSIPRDLLVTLPKCTNPVTGTVYPTRKMQMFNAAFARGELPGGDPACTIATTELLTGIKIDHYIQVDFTGFQNMVQALGGVPICLPHRLKDTNGIVNLPAGEQTLNGGQALAFVRAREGLGNDLNRIDRQKAFLSAMIRKATSTGILLRPDKLFSFLDAATKSVTVDQSLTLGDMRTIATSLGDLDPAHVTFVTVPFDPAPGIDYEKGHKYFGRLKIDIDRAEPLFAAIRNDQPLPGTATAPPRPSPSASASPTGPTLVVAPQEITVDVLNGNGVAGAAGDAASALRELGFDIGRIQTGGTSDAATTVRYGPGKADSARTLAAAVPGAQLQLDPNFGSRLQLLVGTDFPTTLTPVTVDGSPSASGSPSPSPSSTATPSLDTVTADQSLCA